MYEVAKAAPHGKLKSGKKEFHARRTLLVVTPKDSVSEAMVFAIEREFPWIAVERVATLQDSCAAFEEPVSLILVDAMYLHEIDSHSAHIAARHPVAMVALMQDDAWKPLSAYDVFAAKMVRGVLPMNLRLDVWLSVIRLMLRGGEYFPAAMLQSFVWEAPPQNSASNGSGVGSSAESGQERDPLTEREEQILELVSQGLQNKIIAAELRLSEHTVKIHLHNIIKKLGAHNRTQAAAIYHNRREGHPVIRGRGRGLSYS
jgi:DNA-binding NarL/FixJ family response regulator